mgnify:CR=1 FL=1
MSIRNDVEFQAARIGLQEEMIRKQVWSSCLNCDDWEKKEKRCSRFMTQPPPEVLVVGCQFWYEEIPF